MAAGAFEQNDIGAWQDANRAGYGDDEFYTGMVADEVSVEEINGILASESSVAVHGSLTDAADRIRIAQEARKYGQQMQRQSPPISPTRPIWTKGSSRTKR